MSRILYSCMKKKGSFVRFLGKSAFGVLSLFIRIIQYSHLASVFAAIRVKSFKSRRSVHMLICNKRVVHKEETSRHCSKSPDYSQHCRVKREMKINIISPLPSVLRWPLWVCDGLRFSLDNATNPTRLARRFPEMPVFFFRELVNKERKDSVVFISF